MGSCFGFVRYSVAGAVLGVSWVFWGLIGIPVVGVTLRGFWVLVFCRYSGFTLGWRFLAALGFWWVRVACLWVFGGLSRGPVVFVGFGGLI